MKYILNYYLKNLGEFRASFLFYRLIMLEKESFSEYLDRSVQYDQIYHFNFSNVEVLSKFIRNLPKRMRSLINKALISEKFRRKLDISAKHEEVRGL